MHLFIRVALALIFVRDVESKRDNDCDLKCPVGYEKAVNPAHQPRTNGCGTDFLRVTDEFNFTPCCDKHDICYDSCQLKDRHRDTCDKDFLQCMQSTCKTTYKGKKSECLSTAAMYNMATTSFGCKLYKECQSKACSCQKSDL